jgi:hypothetical protein
VAEPQVQAEEGPGQQADPSMSRPMCSEQPVQEEEAAGPSGRPHPEAGTWEQAAVQAHRCSSPFLTPHASEIFAMTHQVAGCSGVACTALGACMFACMLVLIALHNAVEPDAGCKGAACLPGVLCYPLRVNSTGEQ